MIDAGSSRVTAWRRLVDLVVSDVLAGGDEVVDGALVELPHVGEVGKLAARIASTMAWCSSVSMNAPFAPEFDRIHSTCSALDVS